MCNGHSTRDDGGSQTRAVNRRSGSTISIKLNFGMTYVDIEISIPHVHRQGQPDGGRHHHHDPKGTYKQFSINSPPPH